LDTKVVVITGSTQGLGFGYAQAFLQRGHHVVISGRRQSTVDDAIDRLEADAVVGGGVAIGQACDVADLAQVQSLWDFAVRSFGPVDIWLHNAGEPCAGTPVAETADGGVAAMVRSDPVGSSHSAQVAVAGLAAQPRGGKLYLTLCGRGTGAHLPPLTMVHPATARAVRQLAASLVEERRQAKDDRVLIGTISPGLSLTEGLLRGLRALPPAERTTALRQLDVLGDHVSTTAKWIVDRILAGRRQGEEITWLGTGRRLRRRLAYLAGARRGILSRYGIDDG
jgi:NAD(P)-dependent dehydrogenase (short-subunit alcohol dehydrogenase family)